jgi:outer membrane protein assembly factor BamB
MSSPRPHLAAIWLAPMALLVALGAGNAWDLQVPVQGQIMIGGNAGAADGDDPSGNAQNDRVFVRDSPAAWDTFQNGQRMQRLQEWNKAADFYQEVLEKYRDRVVPADADANHTHYTSITRMVQEQLAKWPPEGLAVYRARYEAPAEALLAGKSSDAAALHQVYDRYFVTDAGKNAGIALMDMEMENGQFRAAISIGQWLLKWHPGLGSDAGAVMYRTALAYHFADDEADAQSSLATLAAEHGADRGVVRGQDVSLVDSLRAELKSAGGVVTTAASGGGDSWPMAWGDPSRSRISSAQGKPGVRLYSIPLSKPNYATTPNGPPQQRAMFDQAFKQAVDGGLTVGVMPVTERGELFFQDGQRVYGVSLDSGHPLPGWAQTYPGTGQYTLANMWGSARMNQLTVTLTENEVLAVMGQPDRQALTNGLPMSGEARLVCLDRETGKEKWVASPSSFPASPASLRDIQLSGSPLVVGQSILLIGRTGAGQQVQFEDCYVISIDLRTGKYQWSCYVASANMGDWISMTSALGDNTSHLAFADGLVFVQTNLGALAAVDPYGASLAWVDIYPTQGGNIAAANPFAPLIATQLGNGNGQLPWTCNPVIVSEGRVFTLPAGEKSLLIYDALTGALVQSIPLDSLIDGDASCDTLLGVNGDQVILSGQKVVIGLDWKKYDRNTFTKEDLHKLELPNPIAGRGFVTASAILIPAKDRLWWLDPMADMVVGAYPLHPRNWEDGEGPGNVLVTSNHVVLACAGSVDVYTELALARANLDQSVASAPNDPEPRLRYARLMFAAKDPDTALQKLDEAAALLGGPATLQAGPARDELFTDALTFAGKLASDTRPGMADLAAKFFDRAGLAASAPLQQVHYRQARAQMAEGAKDLAGAVTLYQQILADAQLRSVSLPDADSDMPTQAGVAAEKSIAALIKLDPSVYAPFETAAAAGLQEARTAADDVPAKLLEVAQRYPNSSVAPQAMLAAADAYESAGNPRLAVQMARQLYFRYPDGPDRAQVLETMARNYLAIPGRSDLVAAAAARLAQGAQLPGDPMLTKPLRLPDNRIIEHVHFSEALDEVRKYDGEAALRALPDFHIPVPQSVRSPDGQSVRLSHARPFRPVGPDSAIPNIKDLVLPLRDFARSDRVVAVGTDGKLQIFTPGQSQPLAVADPPANDAPRHSAWLGNNLVIWGSGSLSLFTEEGGAPLWTLQLSQLPLPELVDSKDADSTVAPLNGLPPNIIIRGGGQFIIRGRIRVLRGGVPMIAPVAPVVPVVAAPAVEETTDVIPVGDRILLSTSSGRIVCADLAEGKVVWQARLSEHPIDRLVANEDFTVARVSDSTSVRLVALDTFSGETRGSKSFPLSDNSLVPVNMALSADGTLVYTRPDRLCLKNLYTPWPDPSDREIIGAASLPLFKNGDGAASGPDQLVIAEGRILALADDAAQSGAPQGGGTPKSVRVYSLETGNPVPLRFESPQGNTEVDRVLSAGTSWDVSLRVIGSHLYVFSPDGTAAYNLDQVAEAWSLMDADHKSTIHNVFIGKQYAVVLQSPAPDDGAPPADAPLTLCAFGRYASSPTNPFESGRLDYKVQITDPGAATGPWQAVDGGFYYLSADQKLHMLMGAGDGAK